MRFLLLCKLLWFLLLIFFAFFYCPSLLHFPLPKRFASGVIHHTSELLRSSKALNIYQLKIFSTAVFVHKIQGKLAPNIFLPKFRKFFHSHLTKFSHLNYAKPIPKYGISNRGPFVWINSLSTTKEQNNDTTKFKSKLFSLGYEVSLF